MQEGAIGIPRTTKKGRSRRIETITWATEELNYWMQGREIIHYKSVHAFDDVYSINNFPLTVVTLHFKIDTFRIALLRHEAPFFYVILVLDLKLFAA